MFNDGAAAGLFYGADPRKQNPLLQHAMNTGPAPQTSPKFGAGAKLSLHDRLTAPHKWSRGNALARDLLATCNVTTLAAVAVVLLQRVWLQGLATERQEQTAEPKERTNLATNSAC